MKVKTASRQLLWQIVLLSLALLLLTACDELPLPQGDDSDQLAGAGVVEATEITVAPELGGRVAEVFVSVGDTVTAGDPLLRLDDTVLAGQRRQAQATLAAAVAGAEMAHAALAAATAQNASATLAVESAEAALDAAEAGVRAAEARLQAAQAAVGDAELGLTMALAAARQAARSERVAAWNQELPGAFTTPPWYFQKEEAVQAAESEVAAARTVLENERAGYAAMMADPSYRQYGEAAARLAEAQESFLVAQALLDREVAATDPEELDAYRQELYDAAEAELAEAQSEYGRLVSAEEAAGLLEARARLAVAEERYATARDRRDAMLTGEESLSVQAAGAAVDQAEAGVVQADAAVGQAEAARTQARVAVRQAGAGVDQLQTTIDQARAGVVRAEKGIAQAQAALDLLDLQMEKLVVDAAVSGTVMTRDVQPGEILQPGMVALTLARLDELTVTVYIPENRYGRISLGDSAQVSADSFPEETFAATVVRIADRAEYTPRNVQTGEERQSIVYAVELALAEGTGRLKPGMPADVTFP